MAIPVSGSSEWDVVGRLDLGHFFPAPISMDEQCQIHNEFPKELQKPMGDLVDAFLYLNPEGLVLREQIPADIVLDPEYWAELKRRESLQGFLGDNDLQIVNDAQNVLLTFQTAEETKALINGPLMQRDVQDCLTNRSHSSKH